MHELRIRWWDMQTLRQRQVSERADNKEGTRPRLDVLRATFKEMQVSIIARGAWYCRWVRVWVTEALGLL